MYLRLRATIEKEDVGYAPVVFFAAETVLSSEFQLTAKTVVGTAIFAAVLLRNTRVFGS